MNIFELFKRKNSDLEKVKEVFIEGGLLNSRYTSKSISKVISQKFAPMLKLAVLKDGNIVCFSGTYMNNELGIAGKINNMTYKQLRRYRYTDSKEKVLNINEVLKVCKKENVPILIHFTFCNTKKDIEIILNRLDKEEGRIYYSTSNVFIYNFLKKTTSKKIYFVSGLFKSFNHLEVVFRKDIEKIVALIPTIDDVIVDAEETAEMVIRKLFYAFNKHRTRVDKDHWLLNKVIAHRGICSDKIDEHSVETFEECIKHNVAIEMDITIHGGEIVCYHCDKLPSKIGQEPSIANKVPINNSLKFEDALKSINGEVPIVIDIKTFTFFDRSFEKRVVKILENYKGEFVIQAYSPLTVKWFSKYHPNIIRGQIGNSFNAFGKGRDLVSSIVNLFLFYSGEADYIVYNLDKHVQILSKYNSILGIPVLGYTVRTLEELDKFRPLFDSFILEGEIVTSLAKQKPFI